MADEASVQVDVSVAPVYLGCYEDKDVRDLDAPQMADSTDENGVQFCRDFCLEQGKIFTQGNVCLRVKCHSGAVSELVWRCSRLQGIIISILWIINRLATAHYVTKYER